MTLYESMKKGVHAAAQAAGFQIVRTERMKSLVDPAGSRLAGILRYHGIQTVFDVGGNIGGYGASLRAWGFEGKIISFEPTSAAFKDLSRRAAADTNWIAFNFVLGAEDGVASINVASNSGMSSSLMPMLDAHRESAPEIEYISAEQISVKTLDSAARDVVGPNQTLMLKMDVQGFEHLVLRGAIETLPRVQVIECELSFVPLYEGQLLFPEMLALFESMGFLPVSFDPVFVDRVSGHCLQIEGVFARPHAQ